ncbi:MAG: hypothetical protein GX259_02500 [Bacteroidales bacterium]|nr:hypothetical protein [Bacteroidales bacterium]
MSVSDPVTPLVSIDADEYGICEGELVTFTATPTNGGTSPTYQWYVNGSLAGSDSSVFASTAIANNDKISCVLI